MMGDSEPASVRLRGGLVSSLHALDLLWGLEARHFILEQIGGRLQVQPAERLTAEDIAVISQYRDQLLGLVAYCRLPPEVT